MTTATEEGVAAPAGPAEAASQEKPGFRAWYALVVLIVTMLLAYVDRQILVLLAQAIKPDLGLSDFQIGETHGLAPAVFMVIAMFPLAWLADRFERSWVLAGCVLLWTVATAASGFAVDFFTLLAATIGIVIGEAALSPIVYSLIADLFPPKYRPRANVIAYGASALGSGLAIALGGAIITVAEDARPLLPEIVQSLDPWRIAFLLVAVPGPFIALLVFLIGRTQRVASKEEAPVERAPMLPYIREHGLVALGAFGTMALFNFALQAIANWLPIAFMRGYDADPGEVGVRFGLVFMGGALVGLITASLITPYLRKLAGTAFVLRAIMFASAGSAIPMVLMGFAPDIMTAYALWFCFSAIFIVGVSLMPGMMQDVAPAPLRARVIAAGTVTFLLLGYLSPPLVGFISDQAGEQGNLMWTIIMVALPGFIACAALARFMETPYRRTAAAVAD